MFVKKFVCALSDHLYVTKYFIAAQTTQIS